MHIYTLYSCRLSSSEHDKTDRLTSIIHTAPSDILSFLYPVMPLPIIHQALYGKPPGENPMSMDPTMPNVPFFWKTTSIRPNLDLPSQGRDKREDWETTPSSDKKPPDT